MESIAIKDLTDSYRSDRGTHPHSWLASAIFNTLGDHSKEVFPESEVPPTHIQVELKLNGVEVELSHFINHLHQQYDRMVRAAAVELLKDKMGKTLDAVSKMEETVLRLAKDEFNMWDEGY
jgi:hypothetical protein